MRTHARILAVAVAAAVSAGCGSLIPTAGPSADEVAQSVSAHNTGDYVVVDINEHTVRRLTEFHPVGFGQRFTRTSGTTPRLRIGVGDILAVTIWEAGEGGLFSSGQSKSVNIPALPVDLAGNISLPYAGSIRAAGATPLEVQQKIVRGLASRAIQPQALVTVVKNESNTVVLSGEIATPGRVPISTQGDRLLDVIAAAGGSKAPASEVFVTFVRGEVRGSQILKTIIDDQAENVFVMAGDRIHLSHEPRRYSVFGAVEKPGLYPFGPTRLNLIEAVALSGGLSDSRADATGVFVFRHEPENVVLAVSGATINPINGLVPVVYRINFRDPSAYFYAKSFAVNDRDILYVANAATVEVSKVIRFINSLTPLVGFGRNVQVIAN